MSGLEADDVTKVLKDAAYVTVGLGVMAFQRVQVRRRALHERLNSQFGDLPKRVEDRRRTVEERLEHIEEQVDAILDRVESRLPDPARTASQQARTAAKDARTQLRLLSAARPTG
jgi:hypothetical protein